MEDEVGPHPLAAVFVQDNESQRVTERLFLVEVPAFHHAFRDEHVVQDGLAPAAGHLVLSLEGGSQVVGLLADVLRLVRKVPDGPFQLFFQGSGGFRMRFLLRLESVLHLLQVLVQVTGNALESLLRLAGEFLLPLLEQTLRLGRHFGADGGDLLLEGGVVGLFQEGDGLLVGEEVVFPEGGQGLDFTLRGNQLVLNDIHGFPILGLQDEPSDEDGDHEEGGRDGCDDDEDLFHKAAMAWAATYPVVQAA